MTSQTPQPSSHGDRIPDNEEFERSRAEWRHSLGADEELRRAAVALQVVADQHRYTYTWSWLGVPIIRLPDDVCALQDLVWTYKPDSIVETGVARGGSLILDASLQRLAGVEPHVLGIDLQVLSHTHDALTTHPLATGIDLLEADSLEAATAERVASFLVDSERALLILDSNHTHDHVLGELRALAPLLPVGAFVLVADTLIEEFPGGHFADRPWDRGDNPLTALRAFLDEDERFVADPDWGRRGLLSEFRDGVLRRVR